MNLLTDSENQIITLAAIEENLIKLGDRVMKTPVHQWRGPELERRVGADTEVFLKLELFQFTGSFKARGALTNMIALSPAQLAKGVTAVSAGNHAIATAYAAKVMGSSAKVVMMKTANPFRVAECRKYGAEVVLAANIHEAFDLIKDIQEKEGRFFVHPFEGYRTALGTATLGFEFCTQVKNLDAVIIPIGGGGLCAGMATAIKLLSPQTLVFGVEPEGADSMHRSFAAGKPMGIEKIATIADSLGAPYAAPYTFDLCRRNVDELVMINDDQIKAAMALLFAEMKLAVEPAGAAATAALTGPLAARLKGKRVGVLICGSNIDIDNFANYIRAGLASV
jgi:threonine dehydratase